MYLGTEVSFASFSLFSTGPTPARGMLPDLKHSSFPRERKYWIVKTALWAVSPCIAGPSPLPKTSRETGGSAGWFAGIRSALDGVLISAVQALHSTYNLYQKGDTQMVLQCKQLIIYICWHVSSEGNYSSFSHSCFSEAQSTTVILGHRCVYVWQGVCVGGCCTACLQTSLPHNLAVYFVHMALWL